MLHGTVHVLHKYVKKCCDAVKISSQRFKLAHARCICLNPNWTRELFFMLPSWPKMPGTAEMTSSKLRLGRQHCEIALGRTLLIVSAAGGYKYNPPKHNDQRQKRLESKQIRWSNCRRISYLVIELSEIQPQLLQSVWLANLRIVGCERHWEVDTFVETTSTLFPTFLALHLSQYST